MKGDNEVAADNRLRLIGPGPEARRKKQIFVIKPAQTLDVIHGSEKHMLVSFVVSNDFIHFGLMTIPFIHSLPNELSLTFRCIL